MKREYFTINDDNGIKQIKLRKNLFYTLYTFIGISFIFVAAFIFITFNPNG